MKTELRVGLILLALMVILGAWFILSAQKPLQEPTDTCPGFSGAVSSEKDFELYLQAKKNNDSTLCREISIRSEYCSFGTPINLMEMCLVETGVDPKYICEKEDDCDFLGMHGGGCECVNKDSITQLKDCPITDKICYCDIKTKTCKTRGGFA
jgi:hypothetical protein